MTDISSLVALVADLLGRLGLRGTAEREAAELHTLVSLPWADYRAGRTRSALTSSGAPFELSVKIEETGQPVLRYVVDTADHAHTLIGNRDRYVGLARAIAGVDLGELFERHLRDTPTGEPARVMHGVGFGSGDRRRATLYFPSGWLPLDRRTRLLPESRAAGSGPVEVIGYDYAGATMTRWKTYQWLPVGQVPRSAGLGTAAALHDLFESSVHPACHDRALFLQHSGNGSAVTEKLFFFAAPWGLSTSDGMARLFGFLQNTMNVNLSPLVQVRAAAARHGVTLTLGLLAIGGAATPTTTFYFWPAEPSRVHSRDTPP